MDAGQCSSTTELCQHALRLRLMRGSTHPGGAAALGLQGPAGRGHVCLCVSAARHQRNAPLPLHVHVIDHISYHTPARPSVLSVCHNLSILALNSVNQTYWIHYHAPALANYTQPSCDIVGSLLQAGPQSIHHNLVMINILFSCLAARLCGPVRCMQ